MATQKTRVNSTTLQDIRPIRRSSIQIEPVKKSKFRLSLPHFSLIPYFKRTERKLANTKRKKLIMAGTLITLLIMCIGGYAILSSRATKLADKSQIQIQEQAVSPTLKKGTPEYSTILPADKNINELGGWTRISPPDSDAVFTYTDKIGVQPINVSEQPLPESFTVDTDNKVESLVKGFIANKKITVDGRIVHIASSKGGAQSVIFTKDKLLILIKSAAKIDDNQWAAYINSLQ